jgi:hypothetical protein
VLNATEAQCPTGVFRGPEIKGSVLCPDCDGAGE